MKKNNLIQFTKIRDVKSPNRANSNDAGTDFYIPNFTEDFLVDLKKKNENQKLVYYIKDNNLNISIPPGNEIIIPSGIKVNILDKTTYLEANNKSGIATKKQLLVGASIIDSDYQGEVHINVHNVSDQDIKVQCGDKLVQFIHKEFINTKWEEIDNENYNKIPTSDRGKGGFGSSGTK